LLKGVSQRRTKIFILPLFDMKRFSLWFAALAVSFLTIGLPTLSSAQVAYTISDESTVVVNGASNKSDWSVKAELVEGTVELADGVPTSAQFTIAVANLKSGRSLIMDRLMRGAFEADENPSIDFVMTSAAASEGDAFDIEGDLTMAGVTNPVSIRLTRTQDAAGKYTFTGQSDLNMRDYEMDPPSAMFGALLTKPEVVIQFAIKLTS
jgi:polyisoprenoid-binding protein YceI